MFHGATASGEIWLQANGLGKQLGANAASPVPDDQLIFPSMASADTDAASC
jgi:hypothetical protein